MKTISCWTDNDSKNMSFCKPLCWTWQHKDLWKIRLSLHQMAWNILQQVPLFYMCLEKSPTNLDSKRFHSLRLTHCSIWCGVMAARSIQNIGTEPQSSCLCSKLHYINSLGPFYLCHGNAFSLQNDSHSNPLLRSRDYFSSARTYYEITSINSSRTQSRPKVPFKIKE